MDSRTSERRLGERTVKENQQVDSLLRELAFVRKQIAELQEQQEIAQKMIDESPYMDELRHVKKEIGALWNAAMPLEREVRRRAKDHYKWYGEIHIIPGVTVHPMANTWVEIDDDLSAYLASDNDNPDPVAGKHGGNV